MPIITWRELVQQKNEVMLIDTRTPEEFSFGSIPGAINIPLDDLRDRMSEVPASKPVVLFCAVRVAWISGTTHPDGKWVSECA